MHWSWKAASYYISKMRLTAIHVQMLTALFCSLSNVQCVFSNRRWSRKSSAKHKKRCKKLHMRPKLYIPASPKCNKNKAKHGSSFSTAKWLALMKKSSSKIDNSYVTNFCRIHAKVALIFPSICIYHGLKKAYTQLDNYFSVLLLLKIVWKLLNILI